MDEAAKKDWPPLFVKVVFQNKILPKSKTFVWRLTFLI